MAETQRASIKKPHKAPQPSSTHPQRSGQFFTTNSPAENVLQLQRTLGNQAVQGFFTSGALQAKLKIGQPNDKYEQEADRVAEQVIRRPETRIAKEANRDANPPGYTATGHCPECEDKLQRQIADEDQEEEQLLQAREVPGRTLEVPRSVESYLNSSGGDGQPLSESNRALMEPRFGSDFSGVRVHNDEQAVGAVRELNAQAFTRGEHIYFGAGYYQPDMPLGQRLLTHELTHVVQQRQGRVKPTVQAQGVAINDDAELELEADAMGAKALQMKRAPIRDPSFHHLQNGPQRVNHPSAKIQDQAGKDAPRRSNSTPHRVMSSAFIQRQEATTTSVTPGQLIDQHTSWIGNLDEEALGRDLVKRLPGQSNLVGGVMDNLSGGDRDDVAYEMSYYASNAMLAVIPEDLRLRMAREMAYSSWVTDDEEGEIARIWISFGERLPAVAEANRVLWQKSLWESDQLGDHLQPYKDAFKRDVIGLARAYLSENQQILIEEAQRFGIDLEGIGTPVEKRPGYLEAVQSVAPNVLRLKNYLDELRKIIVGQNPERICDEKCITINVPAFFDPESKPLYPSKSSPTWEEVKIQYDRVSAIIASFADLYPAIYILIQQDKLEDLVRAEDAAKAQDIIAGAMRAVKEKIAESDDKLVTGDIAYYDLMMIHSQLFSGFAKAGYTPSYPWGQSFYMDIANDVLKGHEARQFWVDLGLSLVAAAALIAAPFTGGATAAFLIGFGVGVGIGQAGVSWEKYFDLATLGDAEVKQELALVAEGQISAQLVESIINTVAAFLDVYGATRGIGAGAKVGRAAYEAAEKELKEQVAEQARKKMLREAGKEATLTLGGAGVAVGLHELAQEEPVPDFKVEAEETQIDLTAEASAPSSAFINPMVIQRADGGGSGKAAVSGTGGSSAPLPSTGPEFELYIERALKQGQISGVPQMDFVIPGQYTGSGWGIDRIGIRVHEKSGMVSVYHFEMKFVSPGSQHVSELGTPKAGTQTGRSWTQNAVDRFLDSQNPEARAARERLRRALQNMYPGEYIDKAIMRTFLKKKLVDAKVIVLTPDYADLNKLYRQVAALVRWGRKARIISVKLK
jgi:hypothetical protein